MRRLGLRLAQVPKYGAVRIVHSGRRRIAAKRHSDLLEPARLVFVCGVGGSGTSLLASLMFAHMDISTYSDETSLRLSARHPFGARPSALFVTPEQYFRKVLAMPLRAGWFADGQRYRRQIARTWAEFGRGLPSTDDWQVIDKSPNTSLVCASHLARWYPMAQFILVTRTPSDLSEGWRRKWPLFADVSHEVLSTFHTLCYERAWAEVPRTRRTVVTYEDLTRDPRGIIWQLANVLGLALRDRPLALESSGALGSGQGLRDVGPSGVVNVRAAAEPDDEPSPGSIWHQLWAERLIVTAET